jgi:hypothetical protein
MNLISLYVDMITQVLLADGWHEVADGSFEVGAFEFYDPRNRRRQSLLRSIRDLDKEPEVSEVGFSFQQKDESFIAGPISSVLAVRRRPLSQERKSEGARRPR